MSNWLAFATDLVGLRKPQQLVTQFTDTIVRELGLSKVILLIPSSDGRLLVPHSDQLAYSWSVLDFETPFAHVLQSSKAMHLTAENLIFWQSNPMFCQLASEVSMFDSLWIQPLATEHHRVQSLLLLMGNCSVVESIFSNDNFVKFVELFTQHWSLLYEMEREGQSQRDLKEALSDFQRDIAYRALANELSLTLVGDSNVMLKLREQIVMAAEAQLSVMIQGETGTGKELVAKAVHKCSSRKETSFVAINCAAIPENLLESELFGYCKGAFSGANSTKQGLIAQANGGTLFLDEIGDMPLPLQAKLLRVLESKTFRPLGGKQELTSDFRLISATHVNLLDEVRKKTFRQDLYYRLFQYPIVLPRLVERLDDLEKLSQHFVNEFNRQHNKNVRGLHYQAIDCLKQYDFPGNVRELKHLIEFSCAQTPDGTQITEHCFSQCITAHLNLSTATEHKLMDITELQYPEIKDLKQALNDVEKEIIRERLHYYSGDKGKAAESLGIPKRTLAYKCQKMEIKVQ